MSGELAEPEPAATAPPPREAEQPKPKKPPVTGSAPAEAPGA